MSAVIGKPTIEQVAWIAKCICQNADEQGTFRHLIYDIMGYGGEAYQPLCEAGLLRINNSMTELTPEQVEALQQENEQLRKRGEKGDFMISTGLGHYVTADKILAISSRNSNGHLSNPLSRQIQDAWATGKVIDHTGGRATNSVIHLEGGYLVLSHVRSETLAKRVDVAKEGVPK